MKYQNFNTNGRSSGGISEAKWKGNLSGIDGDSKNFLRSKNRGLSRRPCGCTDKCNGHY